MRCSCNKKSQPVVLNALNAARRIDPTRSDGIRRALIAEINRRFRDLKRELRRVIVDLDIFGLKPSPLLKSPFFNQTVNPRQFQFRTTAEKLQGFNAFLEEEVDAELLVSNIREPAQRSDVARFAGVVGVAAWLDAHILRAYQRGADRSTVAVARLGFATTPVDPLTGEPARLTAQALFSRPIHADKVSLALSRTKEDFKGIVTAMRVAISREVARGLEEGDSASAIATAVNKQVDKVGVARSRTMARTEITRTIHAANIAIMREAGVEGVVVLAEFATQGDSRVCPDCAGLEGLVLTLNEIEFLIPVHAGCRCFAVPVKVPAKRSRAA